MARGELNFESVDSAEKTQERQQEEISEALAGWGLVLSAELQPDEQAEEQAKKQPQEPIFELWPESIEPFNFWLGLQTQWRVGINGCHGLDYTAVWAVLTNLLPASKREQRFVQVRCMEQAALKAYDELRKEQSA